jgi:hypothetical protein
MMGGLGRERLKLALNWRKMCETASKKCGGVGEWGWGGKTGVSLA